MPHPYFKATTCRYLKKGTLQLNSRGTFETFSTCVLLYILYGFCSFQCVQYGLLLLESNCKVWCALYFLHRNPRRTTFTKRPALQLVNLLKQNLTSVTQYPAEFLYLSNRKPGEQTKSLLQEVLNYRQREKNKFSMKTAEFHQISWKKCKSGGNPYFEGIPENLRLPPV